jgi:hypothetical protein
MKYSLILLFACWGITAAAQPAKQRESIHGQIAAMRKIITQAAQDSAAASIAALKLLPQINPDNAQLAAQTNDLLINNYLDDFFRLRTIASGPNSFNTNSITRLKYLLYNVQSDRVRWACYKRVIAERINANDEEDIIKETGADLALMIPARQRTKYDSLLHTWSTLRQGQLIPALTLTDSKGRRLDLSTRGEQIWVIQTYAPADTGSMRAYRDFCSLAQRFTSDSMYHFIGLNLQGENTPASPLPQYHLTAKELPIFRRSYALTGNTRSMVIRNGYFQMATMPEATEDLLATLIQLTSNMHYPQTNEEE